MKEIIKKYFPLLVLFLPSLVFGNLQDGSATGQEIFMILGGLLFLAMILAVADTRSRGALSNPNTALIWMILSLAIGLALCVKFPASPPPAP